MYIMDNRMGVPVLVFEKDLTTPGVQEQEKSVKDVFRHLHQNLIVDLKNVKEIDARGMELLLTMHNTLADRGISERMELCHIDDRLKPLFRTMGFHYRFKIND